MIKKQGHYQVLLHYINCEKRRQRKCFKSSILGRSSSRRCFLAGDSRVNENPNLAVMHTIFMRDHNRIARELKRINPSWANNDLLLFQEARKILIAQWQHVVYNEYLPGMFIFSVQCFCLVLTAHAGYFFWQCFWVTTLCSSLASFLSPRATARTTGTILTQELATPSPLLPSGWATPWYHPLLGKNTNLEDEINKTLVSSTGNDVYSGKNGQAPEVRYSGRFRYSGRCLYT